MKRIIFYTLFISFILYIIPLPGVIKESNTITEAMFMRDNQLAVTFPWKGILIKTGLTTELRAEVLAHEQCHLNQIDEYGVMFMVEYLKNPSKFEEECYKVSDALVILSVK